MNRLNDQQKKEIVEKYANGGTCQKIALEYNVTAMTVSYYARKAHVNRARGRAKTPTTDAQ